MFIKKNKHLQIHKNGMKLHEEWETFLYILPFHMKHIVALTLKKKKKKSVATFLI